MSKRSIIGIGAIEFVFVPQNGMIDLSVRSKNKEIEVPMTKEQASTLADVFKILAV